MVIRCTDLIDGGRIADFEFDDPYASSPLIGGAELERLLGFKTSGAFRQAVHRNTLPIPVFSLANRRGKFAFKKDIAEWFQGLRQRAGTCNG
jgi:hypothetical protein